MSKILSTGDNMAGQESREQSFDVASNTDVSGSSAETGKGTRQRRAPSGGQRAKMAKILLMAILVMAVALTIGFCANPSADATPRKDAGKLAPFNDTDVRCAGVEMMTKCSYIVMWFNASSHECDGGVCVVTTDVLGRRMDEATFGAFEELGCYRELGNCACLYGPLKDLCAADKPCESYPKLLEAGVVNAEPMTYKCEGEKMTVFRDRGEPGALENRTLIGESYLKVSPSGEVYLSPTDAVGAVDLLEGTMIIGIVTDVLTYTPYCDDLAESVCSRQVPPEVGELLPCEYAVFVDDNGLNASSAESFERFCAGKGNRRKLADVGCCSSEYWTHCSTCEKYWHAIVTNWYGTYLSTASPSFWIHYQKNAFDVAVRSDHSMPTLSSCAANGGSGSYESYFARPVYAKLGQQITLSGKEAVTMRWCKRAGESKPGGLATIASTSTILTMNRLCTQSIANDCVATQGVWTVAVVAGVVQVRAQVGGTGRAWLKLPATQVSSASSWSNRDLCNCAGAVCPRNLCT